MSVFASLSGSVERNGKANKMDELYLIERFTALGREVSDIRHADRAYRARRLHNDFERELHEKRRVRLQQIRKDLFICFGIRLAGSDFRPKKKHKDATTRMLANWTGRKVGSSDQVRQSAA